MSKVYSTLLCNAKLSGRSHGRNEVSARHDATEKVVGVSLHSTERHVSSRPHEGNVQPHGDMLQLGPLQLVHRAGISWTDRVGSDVATALHPIRNGVHSQVATCLGEHVEAAFSSS